MTSDGTSCLMDGLTISGLIISLAIFSPNTFSSVSAAALDSVMTGLGGGGLDGGVGTIQAFPSSSSFSSSLLLSLLSSFGFSMIARNGKKLDERC